MVVGGYVHADEVTVRVINKGKGKSDKEYLCMVRTVKGKLVVFHYDGSSRSRQHIRKLLKDFKGYQQSDGYCAYKVKVFECTEEVCLIACMAPKKNKSMAEHALKNNTGDLSGRALS